MTLHYMLPMAVEVRNGGKRKITKGIQWIVGQAWASCGPSGAHSHIGDHMMQTCHCPKRIHDSKQPTN